MKWIVCCNAKVWKYPKYKKMFFLITINIYIDFKTLGMIELIIISLFLALFVCLPICLQDHAKTDSLFFVKLGEGV